MPLLTKDILNNLGLAEEVHSEMYYSTSLIQSFIKNNKFINNLKNFLGLTDLEFIGAIKLSTETSKKSYLTVSFKNEKDLPLLITIHPTEKAYTNYAKALISDNYNPILDCEDSDALDLMLLELPLFTNLNVASRARILNEEFTENTLNLNVLNDFYSQAVAHARKDTITRMENDIQTLVHNISELYKTISYKEIEKQNNITQLYNYINTNLVLNELDLTKLSRNKIIASISYDSANSQIVITTKPVMLNFEQDKIKILRRDNPDFYRILENTPNYKLCIGKHTISIDTNLNIHFMATTKYSNNDGYFTNMHVEHYTCYGTFGDYIQELKQNADVIGLIEVATRLIAHATLGDPAGNRTITGALILNENLQIVSPVLPEHQGMHILDFCNIQERR